MNDKDPSIPAGDLPAADLPAEVTVQDAAEILGVDARTCRQYVIEGLLEARDVSCPSSSRRRFRLKLASVLELRTTYHRADPIHLPIQSSRRQRAVSVPTLRHIKLKA